MLNLQDMFLNQLRKEKIMVTVYLVNGFQLRGYVKGFDTFTIVVENEGRQNLVYKNAVSTITPTKPVKLLENIPVQPESAASEKLSACLLYTSPPTSSWASPAKPMRTSSRQCSCAARCATSVCLPSSFLRDRAPGQLCWTTRFRTRKRPVGSTS